MTSPNGVWFSVVSCDYHDDYKYELKGRILDDSPIETTEEMLSESTQIIDGFLWPEISLEFESMSGFGKKVPVIYHKQQVPSPRLAHVEENASVSDIVLDGEMKMKKPMADESKILDSEKYLDCHRMARQLINYCSDGFYLKKRKCESDDKSLSENPH